MISSLPLLSYFSHLFNLFIHFLCALRRLLKFISSFADLISLNNGLDFFSPSQYEFNICLHSFYLQACFWGCSFIIFLWRIKLELCLLSQTENTEWVFSKNSLCLTEYICLFHGSTFLLRVGSRVQDPITFRARLTSEVSGDAVEEH